MQLVDTHCHLDFPDYGTDLEEVLERATNEGVVRIIVPGTSIASSEKAIELASKYPQIYAACGIHPHEADKVGPAELARLRELATSSSKAVAVGEIGLDYYRDFAEKENQKRLLGECLAIAEGLDLPVILHNREAGEDLLAMLKEHELEGVVHCYSGDEKLLKELLGMGFFISFTGNITFDNAKKLRETIKLVPVERLLLETDAPYITPKPHRGKRNEPAYVKYLIDIYAEIYGLSPGDVARITTHNADELFGLGLEERGVITYPIRDSLYLNITNRCTNRCSFCIRNTTDFVKGHKLRIDREPSAEDLIKEIGDVSRYKEIVFCGYGEPTLRLDVVKEVARHVKDAGGRVRIVTNGEGDIINERPIAHELKGLVDRVSVSLNAPDADIYEDVCSSVFGGEAFDAVLEFIKSCREEGMEVEVTCLDFIGEEKVDACRKIAEDLGAAFRLRHLDTVG